jgi:hypothetical protein
MRANSKQPMNNSFFMIRFLSLLRLKSLDTTEEIEIGESLTAFALSHHLAYGAVPGGSCSRDTQFVMIKEEKQALLYKETVRQCHFQRFSVRQCPRPLAGGCDTACALCADAK